LLTGLTCVTLGLTGVYYINTTKTQNEPTLERRLVSVQGRRGLSSRWTGDLTL